MGRLSTRSLLVGLCAVLLWVESAAPAVATSPEEATARAARTPGPTGPAQPPEPPFAISDRPDDPQLSVDAISETLWNDDGTFTASLTGRPMRWAADDGTWPPYENEIRLATPEELTQGKAFAVAGNGYEASFAALTEVVADRPLLEFASDGVGIGVVAVDAAPTLLSRAGTSLTYTAAFSGADLRYRLDGDRIKEEIVLARPPTVAPVYAFDLQLDGLRAEPTEDGGVDFRDGAGELRFRMPAPFMVDARSDIDRDDHRSNAIAVSLRDIVSTAVRIELRPDLAWLSDPARIYPVVIDPTLVSIDYGGGLGDTAKINEAQPTHQLPRRRHAQRRQDRFG